jgi:hypothetical protein
MEPGIWLVLSCSRTPVLECQVKPRNFHRDAEPATDYSLKRGTDDLQDAGEGTSSVKKKRRPTSPLPRE